MRRKSWVIGGFIGVVALAVLYVTVLWTADRVDHTERDAVIYVDLSRLHRALLVYTADHSGHVPAMSVGKNRPNDRFQFLASDGTTPEDLHEINKRQWIYSVPPAAVGRSIAELGDEDVLLECSGARGIFYLYGSGRIEAVPSEYDHR
jgi:hypothetical protein